MLALRTWKSMSKSGSSTIVGCWRPNGTSTIRARNGATRDTRAATRSRIWWNPTPPGTPVGSNTSTPAMWRWVLGDSKARNAPSSPLSRCTPALPPGRPEATQAPLAGWQLVDFGEVCLLHLLDHQLGDPVPALDLIVHLGIRIDQQHSHFIAIAGIDEPGGVETCHPVAQGQPAPGLHKTGISLSLIHISEPTRQAEISYAVFCLKKKK